ncbi:TetR/AcrR family transcriptional regulator [Streptomyces sp. NPDC057623]|uniref:TetR/AcrR family transcriptional regulator n=1 Tax=Streptomyces sp. NPDC057623 TaxID=3346187 RepID=UPI0036A52F9F
MADTSVSTRAERSARTRAAILEAARQVFAERGFEKATIRTVAERAGCDPSLVMQHFGNKQKLFEAASQVNLDVAEVSAGPADELSERLVRGVFERMDARPDAIASTLRSMLTHDASAKEVLKLFNLLPGIGQEDEQPDEQQALRGRLIGALTLGTAVTRYVLKFAEVEQASVDDLVECLQPAIEALLTPPNGQPISGQPTRQP